MSITSALEKYTKAVEKRNAHLAANKAVFDEHERIVGAVIDADAELRDAAVEIEGLQTDKPTEVANNEDFVVIVQPYSTTVADIETLDKFVAEGKISKEIRDQIVKTNKRPSRVTIRSTK